YVSYACASLDRFDGEMNLPKFIDPACPSPPLCSVIDTALSGDMYGLGMGAPDRPLNTENHPGYSSEIHMAVNLGGALPDSTWLEVGDVPMVGLHNVDDPFAPYTTDWVIVPLTGKLVVIVSGSHDAIRRANRLGNNDILKTVTWSDPFSIRANTVLVSHLGDTIPHQENIEGLFPLILPTPSSPTWEWWDPTNPIACTTNDPNLSKVISLAYIDTVMGYVNPRIVVALGLDTTGGRYISEIFSCCVNAIEENIDPGSITIYPNPANTSLTIHSKDPSDPILVIELYNATGQMVRRVFNVNITSRYALKRKGLPNGLYMIKVKTKEGNTMKKVVFE
ncbi:MAG: T9SS type A sorting domain-containing protein, partial [Cytophagales bacterium]|nr:T9SS type A sorting domain-containing protein [Cytophagales bacterium]